jgi:hypothetical protein
MEQSSTLLGAGLLAQLKADDGLGEREGQDWISCKAGRPYDAGAMYELRWPGEEDPKTWSECADLRVRVMSDAELDRLEVEQRRRRGLPPRRPWEARMFQSSRGRVER